MDFASIIKEQVSHLQENSSPLTSVPLLIEYTRFSNQYRNLAPETIVEQMTYLMRFFRWVKCSLSDKQSKPLCPDTVQQFAFEYGNNNGPGSRHWMYYSLRSFLRFAYYEGYLAQDLAPAVPTQHKRCLSHVPFVIDDESITRLLEKIDRSEAKGIRDYAIIQLLATYGVRGIQVRKLKLQDIEWKKDQLYFHAVKGGNTIVQHLTDKVGNALVEYIRNVRPENTSLPEVFLTLKKPFIPLSSSSSLSMIIKHHLHKANISLPDGALKGSHLFRHAFATRMLKHGQQFKNIADMLGHKYLDSTFLYTKVDFEMLKETTLEWPEV